MLIVENLKTFYGSSQVLFGMELRVQEGEVVTLLGRNGMGKTTTVNSIMGIVPSQGNVEFNGQPINGQPAFRIAKAGLGLVPEGRQIFPNLSVRENLVATAANRSGRKDPWTIDRVFEMFPELRARAGSMGNLLSGGEQQMLAIGRALLTNPDLLILDEATEGLAPVVRGDIWACIRQLRELRQSLLVIDSNLEALMAVCDRHYVIEKGRIVWSGSSADFEAQPEIKEKYLGV